MDLPAGIHRVLIVDDQDAICKALKHLLEEQKTFQLCGEANNGCEAVRMAIDLKPEIIVMDISMPVMDGLEATRQIHRLLPEIEILIFTQHDPLQAVKAAKDAGAQGCLCKSEASLHLVPALQCLCIHQPYFPASSSL